MNSFNPKKQNFGDTEYNKIFEDLSEIDFEILDRTDLQLYSFSSLANKLNLPLRSIEREYERLEKNGLVKLIIIEKIKLTSRGRIFINMIRNDIGIIDTTDLYTVRRNENENSFE